MAGAGFPGDNIFWTLNQVVLFIKVPPHGQDSSPLAKGTSPSRVADRPLLYVLEMSHRRVWLQGQEGVGECVARGAGLAALRRQARLQPSTGKRPLSCGGCCCCCSCCFQIPVCVYLKGPDRPRMCYFSVVFLSVFSRVCTGAMLHAMGIW